MAIRVLIADDQPELREALRALVDDEPYLEVVGVAADADEAIALARSEQPDVALVDFKMPAGGGPRATREIGVHCPRTRVVALSAYEDRGAVLAMVQAGAAAYVVKGASGGEIRDTILRAARGEGFLSPEVAGQVVHELSGQLRRDAQLEEEQAERKARVLRALGPGSLTMVFQPIAALDDGRAIGYEALLRVLVEPQRPPPAWFEEAEAAGLQTQLELAAVRTAFASLELLPDDTFLAVNVSPRTVVSPVLLQVLGESAARRLVLEMTEHVPVDDYEALRESLRPFRAAGGRIAVDDAGAGFASLRHVLELAPDVLKIDASVVREVADNPTARALTSAVVAFANELGQLVVAEGIESEEVVSILHDLGVRFGQGYHICRPGDLRTVLSTRPRAPA